MPEPLEEDYDGDKVGDEVMKTETTDQPLEVLKPNPDLQVNEVRARGDIAPGHD